MQKRLFITNEDNTDKEFLKLTCFLVLLVWKQDKIAGEEVYWVPYSVLLQTPEC